MATLESPGVLFTWEALRSLLFVLIAGLLAWACTLLLGLRDMVRDLSVEVKGVDGTNGLKSKVTVLIGKVESIEDRHARLDAIKEYERQQHPGEDRRRESRRLSDIVRDQELKDTP